MHFVVSCCIFLTMLSLTVGYSYRLHTARIVFHKRRISPLGTCISFYLTRRPASSSSNDWESASKASTLVIVESPAKARTIQKFVNSDSYVIDYSAGHIRDLTAKLDHAPAHKDKIIDTELQLNTARMGVDVHDNFKPLYMTMHGKGEIVKRLKALSKNATRIILATDEDREGEAISWHLLEVLKPTVPYKRAVFHEITKEAILKAFEQPRDLDMNLVHSQETRRILDRLAGFTLSPVLWRYIAPGLSAGRVQSCGLHSITERERSRWEFVPSSYCSVSALLDCAPAVQNKGTGRTRSTPSGETTTLLAKLYSVNTRRVANERDFDSATGDLRKASPGSNSSSSSTSSSTAVATKPPASSPPGEVSAFDKDRLVVLDESMTQQLMAWLSGGVGGGGSKSTSTAGGKMASSALPPSSSPAPVFRVTDVDSRKTSRKPPPPFITSSLQQESSRKHGFSPSRTMGIAQSLYEKGHITYMRTDSPTLSATALIASQKMASKLFGADSLPSAGDLLETSAKKAAAKVGKEGGVPKNAQEAHEAIRPAEISGRFALPEDLAGLSQEEKTLYGLILRRTLASVMKPSQSATCTYTITASSSPVEGTGFTEAVFRSSDTRVIFPGFLVALDMFGKKVPAKGSFSTATQQEQGSILPGQVLKLSDRKDFSDLLRSSSSTEEGADGAGGAADAGLAQPSDGSEASASAVEVAPAPAFPGLNSARHTTRPPSRFTEASFIQEMEELGVGRPSTYSAILHTLKEREYIVVERQTIIPTIKGMVVCEFLAKHFPQFVDAQFTAEMEKNLDLIARGECDKVDFLSRFYLQDEPVSDTDKRAATLKKGLLPTIRQKLRSEEFNHADSRRLHVPFLQDIGVLTYSKNGASVETFVPQRAATNATGALSSEVTDREFSGLKWSLPEAMQQDIRGITSEAVRKLLEQESPTSGTVLGVLPGTQLKVYQKAGRYGRFVQVGEKSSAKFFSVPSWMNSSPRNLTLGDALDLIHLPRVLCMHAELNKSIVADMNRNVLSVGVEGFPLRVPVPEGLLVKDVTVEMALQLLPPAAEITSAGGSLGLWRDNPVVVVHGKFGPYVRSGMVVGGIKGDLANSTSSITLAQAVEILETRGKVLGGKFAKPGATAATPKAKKVPKTKAEKAPAAKLATKKAADNDALDGDQGVKPKRASSTEKTKFAAAAGAGGDSSPALGEKATTLTAVEAVNQPRRVVTKSGKTNVDMPPADTDKDGDGKGASVPKKATTRKPRSAPPSV